jgi:hypothetical protein
MSVDGLEHRLQQFADGDASFSEVRAALNAAVAVSGANYDSISRTLEAARGNGLPGPLFAVLTDQVQAAADIDRTQTLQASAPEHGLASAPEHGSPTETGEPSDATHSASVTASGAFAHESAPDSRTRPPEGGSASPGGADATLVAPPEPEATLRTGQTGHESVGADPGLAPQSKQPDRSVTPELGPGSILRSRFELIELLGEGGMGAVWKGLDLLKVEARDRNPYVAIKLLGGDFRQHPESFIALQRETAKQQRLAHPNIATVYDFDRDEQRDVVS